MELLLQPLGRPYRGFDDMSPVMVIDRYVAFQGLYTVPYLHLRWKAPQYVGTKSRHRASDGESLDSLNLHEMDTLRQMVRIPRSEYY